MWSNMNILERSLLSIGKMNDSKNDDQVYI